MKTAESKEKDTGRSKKLKRVVYWLIIGIIIIYTFFFTRYNLINYHQTKQSNRYLKEQLEEMKTQNEELKKEIEDLRTNPETWERIAREKYGMQKEGEKVIIFSKEPE